MHVKESLSFHTQKTSFPAPISTVHTISALNISYSIPAACFHFWTAFMVFWRLRGGKGARERERPVFHIQLFIFRGCLSVKKHFQYVLYTWASTTNKPWQTDAYIHNAASVYDSEESHCLCSIMCLHCSDCIRYSIDISFRSQSKLKERLFTLKLAHNYMWYTSFAFLITSGKNDLKVKRSPLRTDCKLSPYLWQ